MLEIKRLQKDNTCLQHTIGIIEVKIVELTSKVMAKDEEAIKKDDAWNQEYASLVAVLGDLKVEALKCYEECLSNRVSQFLTYRSKPPRNGSREIL